MATTSDSLVEYGSRRIIITATAVVCAALELIDTTIVNVALNDLRGNLGATVNEIGWVITAYSLANVIIVPMTSWLSQQFGTIIASLIIAGAFLVIAVIPVVIYSAKQKQEERRVAEAAAKARATQWISPATVSLGLQAARMLGKNRGIAAAGVGALLAVWLISQMLPAEERTDDEAATEPAE